MALKRRHKIESNFSMASMTDVIFLLLIFFMVTSTIVFPNSIKVNLPQSKQQTATKPVARITIDENMDYFIAYGSEHSRQVTYQELNEFLTNMQGKDPEMYVALYADEIVPYREIVKVLNVANENKLKMVLATRPLRSDK